MGRLSETFCCCFGSSTYEVAPETDDFNTVIFRNHNRNGENDLTEKLLQSQSLQIEIKPNNQKEFPENFNANSHKNIKEFSNLPEVLQNHQTTQETCDKLEHSNSLLTLELQQTHNFKEFLNLRLTQELKKKFNALETPPNRKVYESFETDNEVGNESFENCSNLQGNKFVDSEDEDLKIKFDLKNEIEQSLAAAISDRATDEVLEALTRYRRGLGIADSPSVMLDEPQTPDIVRSQSSHDTDGMIIRPGRGSILPKLGLESPTKLEYLNLATPHMPTKRRSIAQRKVRPQSVVENLSLGHIPDLLESPSSHRSTSQMSRRDSSVNGENGTSDSRTALDDGGGDGDECCDSITELPSASFQLQHLVKGRPKRAKTRAPTRPLVGMESGGTKEIGEGLDQFFRPGSVTPTTLTPLVSPTSEECSSLSFVDSPTMSRNGNDQMTSEETTPILEERKPIKLERSSPLLRGAAWATRSRSTDNLEKYSPLVGRKSPLVKMRTESGGAGGDGMDSLPNHAERLLKSASGREDKTRSPSTDSIKSHTDSTSVIVKTGNGILRTPIVLQKPRPWSVVGNDSKQSQSANSSESTKTTPEKLDEEDQVVPFGQSGGSIVGISPGIAIAQGGSGGGSIVGITPGAAMEKKSVRELAAGLNRLDLPLKPQVLPRSLLTSSSSSAISKISSNHNGSNINNKTSAMSSSTTVIAASSVSSSSSTNETLSKSMTTSCTNSSDTSEINISNSIIAENGKNDVLNVRNSKKFALNEFLNNEMRQEANTKELTSSTAAGFKRIAGKEISTMFEETLVEGLQRSSVRRTFRDTQYTKEDVVDL